METVILKSYAKIVKNVAMTSKTILHMKIVIIHFILNSFLAKHYNVPCSRQLKIVFVVVIYNYITI